VSAIEQIRAEVEEVRKEHRNKDSHLYTSGHGYCPVCLWKGKIGARERWPCPTLRLAEDKLKLALHIDRGDPDDTEGILAEVAR
jgi:hypothetical protein